jgi:hypothetical protein
MGVLTRDNVETLYDKPLKKGKKKMKNFSWLLFIRFAAIFALLYLVVGGLTTIVRVHMDGWQFIILIIVLTGIAEYIVERR